MARILVIRLSALGDVAMLVPVITSAAQAYPQHTFCLMTRPAFTKLFANLPANIETFPVDLKNEYNGYRGLLKLSRKCLSLKFTHVADIHNVLRTKVIRDVLFLCRKKVKHINKGRKDKKRMIKTKVTQPPLLHMTERYREVFAKLGFPFDISFNSLMDYIPLDIDKITPVTGVKNGIWIGIAPFAQHKGKIYPLEKMENVIPLLLSNSNVKLFFLGGGIAETKILEEWEAKYRTQAISLAGKFDMEKEIQIISMMDLVISMDSANMHFASLVNTPVVSIWGATHPSLGFYGFRQNPSNAVQVNLPCRPCSVFGNKPCIRNNSYDCLYMITEQMVVDKVWEVINNKK